MNWYWVAALLNMKENIASRLILIEIKKFNTSTIPEPTDLKAIAEQIITIAFYCIQALDIYSV